MFFKLILENENGDRVNLTTTANQYITSKIDAVCISFCLNELLSIVENTCLMTKED